MLLLLQQAHRHLLRLRQAHQRLRHQVRHRVHQHPVQVRVLVQVQPVRHYGRH
jgi:hypothetical protein